MRPSYRLVFLPYSVTYTCGGKEVLYKHTIKCTLSVFRDKTHIINIGMYTAHLGMAYFEFSSISQARLIRKYSLSSILIIRSAPTTPRFLTLQ